MKKKFKFAEDLHLFSTNGVFDNIDEYKWNVVVDYVKGVCNNFDGITVTTDDTLKEIKITLPNPNVYINLHVYPKTIKIKYTTFGGIRESTCELGGTISLSVKLHYVFTETHGYMGHVLGTGGVEDDNIEDIDEDEDDLINYSETEFKDICKGISEKYRGYFEKGIFDKSSIDSIVSTIEDEFMFPSVNVTIDSEYIDHYIKQNYKNDVVILNLSYLVKIKMKVSKWGVIIWYPTLTGVRNLNVDIRDEVPFVDRLLDIVLESMKLVNQEIKYGVPGLTLLTKFFTQYNWYLSEVTDTVNKLYVTHYNDDTHTETCLLNIDIEHENGIPVIVSISTLYPIIETKTYDVPKDIDYGNKGIEFNIWLLSKLKHPEYKFYPTRLADIW